MLPAAVRMRASAEFSDTVTRGVRCAVGPIVIHLKVPTVAPTGDSAPSRVGLIVSRAVGNAVVRHRVSLRLRHLLLGRLAVLPPGSRLVVRALPAAAEAESAGLAAALDRALARATSRRLPGRAAEGASR